MRYSKWEQRQMDQESGARLDAQERAHQAEIISYYAHPFEFVDYDVLDQWEREQYNRLKLEQETSNDLDR